MGYEHSIARIHNELVDLKNRLNSLEVVNKLNITQTMKEGDFLRWVAKRLANLEGKSHLDTDSGNGFDYVLRLYELAAELERRGLC